MVIDAGDIFVFDCPEPCGQVTLDWTDDDLASTDFELIHAPVGSVYVNGAEPGDTLELEALDLAHRGWWWTGHLECFGLLTEDSDHAYIHRWRLEDDLCHFGINDISVPFEPICGTMGIAPREPGRMNTIPPRENAGNIDIRHLNPGPVAWFPIFLQGALFACGDCHSAQGSGQVYGTGTESPMVATLRFNPRKDLRLNERQIQTPRPLTRGDREWLSRYNGERTRPLRELEA